MVCCDVLCCAVVWCGVGCCGVLCCGRDGVREVLPEGGGI